MDQQIILNTIFSIVPKNQIQSIASYGLTGGYTQILAIGNRGSYYRSFVADPYCLCLISDNMAWQVMKNFDPVVTEPILVGDIIFGRNLQNYRRYLFDLAADKETLNYLISIAKQYALSAESSLDQDSEVNFLKSGLYFSVLYASLALYYLIRPRATSIQRLILEKRSPFLAEASELFFTSENKDQAAYRRFYAKAQDYVQDVHLKISFAPSGRRPARARLH